MATVAKAKKPVVKPAVGKGQIRKTSDGTYLRVVRVSSNGDVVVRKRKGTHGRYRETSETVKPLSFKKLKLVKEG